MHIFYFFSWISGPNNTTLDTKFPYGNRLFNGEIITKQWKYGVYLANSSSQEPLNQKSKYLQRSLIQYFGLKRGSKWIKIQNGKVVKTHTLKLWANIKASIKFQAFTERYKAKMISNLLLKVFNATVWKITLQVSLITYWRFWIVKTLTPEPKPRPIQDSDLNIELYSEQILRYSFQVLQLFRKHY